METVSTSVEILHPDVYRLFFKVPDLCVIHSARQHVCSELHHVPRRNHLLASRDEHIQVSFSLDKNGAFKYSIVGVASEPCYSVCYRT